jgi:hypothetical protein
MDVLRYYLINKSFQKFLIFLNYSPRFLQYSWNSRKFLLVSFEFLEFLRHSLSSQQQRLVTHYLSMFNPFTRDFDLPKRICLNGLFLFFFDKVRHFLSKFSTLVTSQKKCFLHFLKHRKVFLKNVVLQVFLSNLNNHLFLKFWKNLHFWIS